jgi:DNA-binding LacI/PurR family transcriptional regulator
MKMSQIAHLAGLSTATVSMAFHSPQLMRPEIRNRVLKIAKANNCLYHAPAGDLSRRRSNITGILIPTANKSAVLAAGDRLAIGAYTAVKTSGFEIPGDIAVVGFDDIDVAAYCDPPLTTIRVPAREIGTLAVELLLDAIEKGISRVRRYARDTELVVRSSCAESN